MSTKEAILIEVHLPFDERLEVQSEVVYRVERVGFAARFVNLPAHDEEILRAYIERQEVESFKSPLI